MSILNIAGLAVTAAILAALLRKYQPEYSVAIGLITAVLILALAISKVQPAFNEINNLMSSASVNTQYVSILIKALGICFVAQLASDICRDAGETAIASNVELAGKLAVLIVALPLFGQVADLVLKLMD